MCGFFYDSFGTSFLAASTKEWSIVKDSLSVDSPKANQELFELQSKFDDLNYQILRDNIENLTEKQKKELQEYVELEKMKKKYYGYLATEHFK